MKKNFETIIVGEEELNFESFKEKVRKIGYDYFIVCIPTIQEEETIACACKGDEELINICLELSETHFLKVEHLSCPDWFELN
ncbi:MAG: hypothetical protein WCP52_02075 [Bacteroidota bacterium]